MAEQIGPNLYRLTHQEFKALSPTSQLVARAAIKAGYLIISGDEARPGEKPGRQEDEKPGVTSFAT